MLSPPAQLKVDKFPHHEGLSEADGGQHSYPDREGGGKRAITKIIIKIDTGRRFISKSVHDALF